MKPTILVTGADGMLGSHIVRELIVRGFIVRAFIQPGRKVRTLEGLNIDTFEGDILNIADVETAMKDCEYVIHSAASTSIYPARNRKVYDINLEGTMNVTAAAAKSNIKRMVHISSASVFNSGDIIAPGNENGQFTGHSYGLDYINSKYDAQKVVMKAVYNGLDAVIINPTFMIGAYDSQPGSGSIILAMHKGKILVNPPGGKNFICVKDVSIAVCNALTMGRKGECYILGNQNLTYKDFLKETGKIINKKAPLFSPPAKFIKLFSLFTQLLSAITKKPPVISRQVATMSCENQFFTATKAVRELSLPQTPISEGIKEAFSWFKSNGYA